MSRFYAALTVPAVALINEKYSAEYSIRPAFGSFYRFNRLGSLDATRALESFACVASSPFSSSSNSEIDQYNEDPDRRHDNERNPLDPLDPLDLPSEQPARQNSIDKTDRNSHSSDCVNNSAGDLRKDQQGNVDTSAEVTENVVQSDVEMTKPTDLMDEHSKGSVQNLSSGSIETQQDVDSEQHDQHDRHDGGVITDDGKNTKKITNESHEENSTSNVALPITMNKCLETVAVVESLVIEPALDVEFPTNRGRLGLTRQQNEVQLPEAEQQGDAGDNDIQRQQMLRRASVDSNNQRRSEDASLGRDIEVGTNLMPRQHSETEEDVSSKPRRMVMKGTETL